MQGLRKILRALAIVASAAASCWLLIDAAIYGPGEYQLGIALVLMIAAVGLTATWFWSPLG
jgi:hypothetical protein